MSLTCGFAAAPTCPGKRPLKFWKATKRAATNLTFFAGLLYRATRAALPSANICVDNGMPNPVVAEAEVYSPVLTPLQDVTTASPSDVEGVFAAISNIYETEAAPNLLEAVGKIISSGLSAIGLGDIKEYISGIANEETSDSNINPREPPTAIYPKATSKDAPYSFSEAKLRGAIHIPPDFRYGENGAPQPVILVGGTGNPGYVTYAGSYIPLLQDEATSFGDPVWLNMPGHALEDVQTNAEYVAYAIGYVHGISNGRQVAVFGYSQGNVDAQWAYKFWPSTREKVSDHVAFSPGYHGTVVTSLLGLVPQPPAWLQSTYGSDFVASMRGGGGDSAYVPTTVIYSATDQVVQPQRGPGASAPLDDVRGVGVSNILVQNVCLGRPAGGFYTHEAILVHPLAYALARDALAHDGPGKVERLDLESVCGRLLAPGLTLGDLLLTENNVVFAGATTLLYHGKSWFEPGIKEYAR